MFDDSSLEDIVLVDTKGTTDNTNDGEGNHVRVSPSFIIDHKYYDDQDQGHEAEVDYGVLEER